MGIGELKSNLVDKKLILGLWDILDSVTILWGGLSTDKMLVLLLIQVYLLINIPIFLSVCWNKNHSRIYINKIQLNVYWNRIESKYFILVFITFYNKADLAFSFRFISEVLMDRDILRGVNQTRIMTLRHIIKSVILNLFTTRLWNLWLSVFYSFDVCDSNGSSF